MPEASDQEFFDLKRVFRQGVMRNTFTILLADKNSKVSDFLRRELAAEGYEVAVAEDGGRIIEQIEGDSRVDLLLLDLEMPGANSSAIFEKTRNRRPPLPVVIHTFLTEESERGVSRDDGEIYIKKSGNIAYLKEAIAGMLKTFYPDGPMNAQHRHSQ